MIKIPYKFEDCISTASPFLKGSKEFIVIYPINDALPNNEIKSEEQTIVHGYLYAAQLIVDSIYREYQETSAIHDRLTLPLLSLYLCVLEFCLKLLIKKLDEHRENGTCRTINKLEESSEFNILVKILHSSSLPINILGIPNLLFTLYDLYKVNNRFKTEGLSQSVCW